MTASNKFADGLRTFASDIAQGLFLITHSGFSMLGLAVMFAAVTLVARPEIRELGETELMGWLQSRQPATVAATTDETACGLVRIISSVVNNTSAYK